MLSQAPPLSICENRIHALGHFLQTLRDTTTNPERIQATLDYLQLQVEPALIWIGVYNPETQKMDYQGGAIQDFDSHHLPQSLAFAVGDLVEQVFTHQNPIGVSDLSTEARSPELIDLALKFAILGCAVLPICDRKTCRGIVILGWQQPGLTLHPDLSSCLKLALKDLGTRLTRETDPEAIQGYENAGTLPGLLDKLCHCATLEAVIDTIALEVHSLIHPVETRIFWLDPQRYTFDCLKTLIQGKRNSKGVGEDAHLSIRDMGKLYPDLRSGQAMPLIAGANATTAEILAQVVNQPQNHSALLTPIRSAQTLLGFILVSYKTLNPLQDNAKQLLKTAADALALAGAKLVQSNGRTSPVDVLQSCVQALSTVEIGATGLKSLAVSLCQSLQAKHFSVIHFDSEAQDFGVSLQMTAHKRQLLPSRLGNLAPLDWEMLSQTDPVICIDHWAEDLRLINWRPAFAELGIESILICRLKWADTFEAVLVIGHDTPRVWLPDEIRLVGHLCAPLGWLVNQWRERHYRDERQRLSQSVLIAIAKIQQIDSLEELDHLAPQTLSEVFSTAMTALVTWHPTQTTGTLAALYPPPKQCPMAIGQPLELSQAPLLTALLNHPDRMVHYPQTHFPSNWIEWFPAGNYDHGIAIALQSSPNHAVTGALFLGVKRFSQDWQGERIVALQTLVREVALVRHSLLAKTQWAWNQQHLQQLHWYKLQMGKQMRERLSLQVNWLTQQESTFHHGAEQTTTPTLLKRRYQDLLQSLTGITDELLGQSTPWQLPMKTEKVLLPTFLKGILERLEPISRKYQIWTQIHPLSEDSTVALHQISIQGEIGHYQSILDELLGMACGRCLPQSRIDFWPRVLDDAWLELSITDTSIVDARLIQALSVGQIDPLLPSPLDYPPGLQLWICQHLIRSLSGDLGFYQLDDGRFLTRLVLPITQGRS